MSGHGQGWSAVCGLFLEAGPWKEELTRVFFEEGENKQLLYISYYLVPCKFFKKLRVRLLVKMEA